MFTDTINKRAIIDKIEISVWGSRRTIPRNTVEATSDDFPIGGHDPAQPRIRRFYGHGQFYELRSTRNPIFLKHGVLIPFPSIPDLRFQLRSEAEPLTCKQIKEGMDALCQSNYSFRITNLELTYDLTDYSIELLQKQAFTRGWRLRAFADETYYNGSPSSASQFRTYRKKRNQEPREIARAESILRPRFLKKHGIYQLEDVKLLRVLDLSQLLDFKEFIPGCINAFLDKIGDDCLREAVQAVFDHQTFQQTARMLRKDYRIDPRPLLRTSPVGLLVKSMRGKLVC